MNICSSLIQHIWQTVGPVPTSHLRTTMAAESPPGVARVTLEQVWTRPETVVVGSSADPSDSHFQGSESEERLGGHVSKKSPPALSKGKKPPSTIGPKIDQFKENFRFFPPL